VEQWKMIIAWNSAYVQAETLNFTFAWQAIIVYFVASVRQVAEHWSDWMQSSGRFSGPPGIRLTSRLLFANNVGLYINSQQTYRLHT